MRAIAALVLLTVVWFLWRRCNRRLYGDAFSPLNLLFYFWIGPFIVSLADLSALQAGWAVEAVAVIMSSTAILVATCCLPAIMGVGRHFRTDAAIFDGAGRIAPTAVFGFFLMTLVALYFAEFSGHDLPLSVYLLGGAADSNLHTAGKDSKLQVIAFGVHAAAIFLFFMWLVERRPVLRWVCFALSALVILLGFVKASKSDIFIPFLSYGGLVYYRYRSRNQRLPKVYKITAIVTVIAVISVTSIRLEGVGTGILGGYAGLIDFRYGEELGTGVSEIVAITYGYTALGFQNFSNYVGSHTVEFRVGTSLFRPLLSTLMMGDVADSMGVPVSDWNVVSTAANTGTFLTPLYIEGGFLFCAFGSLLYGLLVNFLYMSYRLKPSAGWMFGYIAVLFPWTWLFFTNAFSVLSIYVNLFYLAVLAWAAIRSDAELRRRAPGPLVAQPPICAGV